MALTADERADLAAELRKIVPALPEIVAVLPGQIVFTGEDDG